MYKFVGFVIILISCIKIGLDMSDKYKNRTRELHSLIQSFEIMCKEISFTSMLLSDVLMSAADVRNKPIKKLISVVSETILLNKATPQQAYRDYIKSVNHGLSLHKDDLDILDVYFGNCGSGDVNDEINFIKSAVSALKVNKENALNNENKYVKLFRFTGILTGIAIGIIFI